MNETIINGIDVSGCKYYDGGTCCNEDVLALSCDKTDCIYKQLKRLQEENEKQKEEIKQLEDFIKSDGEIVHINHEYTYKLQKENEELKKLKCKFKEYCTCNIEKYRSALEEIREIAQIHQYFNPELLEIKGDIGQMQDLKMTEIFKKCNEVLNDRD